MLSAYAAYASASGNEPSPFNAKCAACPFPIVTNAHGCTVLAEGIDVVATMAMAVGASVVLAVGAVTDEYVFHNMSGRVAHVTAGVAVVLVDLVVETCSLIMCGSQRRGPRIEQYHSELGVKGLDVDSADVPHDEPLVERRGQLDVPSGGRKAAEVTRGVLADRAPTRLGDERRHRGYRPSNKGARDHPQFDCEEEACGGNRNEDRELPLGASEAVTWGGMLFKARWAGAAPCWASHACSWV